VVQSILHHCGLGECYRAMYTGDSRINHDRVVGSEKSSTDNKSLHNILDLCFYSNLFRWFIFMKVVGVVELEAHWKARR
jgi:hypothetical protein